MKRFILPTIAVLAAGWAGFSVVRTQPRRAPTDPPVPPATSDFRQTVAAVGLVEASTENIAISTPVSGLVVTVLAHAGDRVDGAGLCPAQSVAGGFGDPLRVPV